MKKRILAFTLSLALVMQILPTTVFATDSDVKPTQAITAFEDLAEEISSQLIALGSTNTPVLPDKVNATLTTTTVIETAVDADGYVIADDAILRDKDGYIIENDTQKLSLVKSTSDETVELEVTWESDAEFKTDEAGTFTYTAELKDSTYAVEAPMPTINVAVGIVPKMLKSTPVDNWTFAGQQADSGTDFTRTADGVEVHTARGLAWIAFRVNNGLDTFEGETVKLTADIDLRTGNVSGYGGSGNIPSFSIASKSWNPIGSSSNQFKGTFDGQGYTVSNVYIVGDTDAHSGLFGYVGNTSDNYAAILNVGVVDSSIENINDTSSSRVGALVGYSSNVVIANCYSTAKVSATTSQATYVGGLIGAMGIGIVANSYALADVTSNSSEARLGGLMGLDSHNMKLINCYSIPTNITIDTDPTAKPYIGTLVGDANGYDEDDYTNFFYEKGKTPFGSLQQEDALLDTTAYLLSEMKSQAFVDELNRQVVANYYYYSHYTRLPFELASWEYNSGGYPTLADKYNKPAWETIGENASSTTDYTIDGDGNVSVKTAKGLAWVATQVNLRIDDFDNKTVTLANDIDLRDAGVTGYTGTGNTANSTVTYQNSWMPIGVDNSFAGTFDGGSHTISGMYIVDSEITVLGLFGSINGANIINVNLIDSSIDSARAHDDNVYIGSLIGYTPRYSNVLNCFSSADITYNNEAGAGANYYDSFIVGGLIGYFSDSNLINSAATGNISSISDIGHIGGLIGYNEADELTNSYYAGTITASGTAKVGAISGYSSTIGDKVNSMYYLSTNGSAFGETSTDGATASAKALTDAELKAEGFITNLNTWVASSTVELMAWEKSSLSDYPTPTATGTLLEWVKLGNNATIDTDYTRDDTDKTITISTPKGLAWLANTVNNGDALQGYTITLLENINLSTAGVYGTDFSAVTALNSWVPIGNTDTAEFSGTFDGNDKTISYLYINKPEGIGSLFGYVSEFGTIKDLTISTSSITASGVAGFAYDLDGEISNCTNYATLNSNATRYVGGIVGWFSGEMLGCFNHGNITAENTSTLDIGGLVGNNVGKIISSGNYGNITAESTAAINAGGVAGAAGSGAWGEIGKSTNVFNQGNLTINNYLEGTQHLGGIFGFVQNNPNVTNAYNSGTLTPSSGTRVGALIGERYSNSTSLIFKNVYYLTGTASKAVGTGTTVGASADLAGLRAETDTFNDWILDNMPESAYWWNNPTDTTEPPIISMGIPSNMYSITVNNGGTSSHTVAKAGTTITINTGSISDNKMFDSWVVADSKVIPGLDLEAPSTTFSMPAFDVELTPNIVDRTYTVTFDKNTGTGADIPTIQAQYSYSFDLPADDTFTPPPNKTFAGWSLTPTGDDIITAATYIPYFTDTKDFTLYAIWRDFHTYNISFNSNVSFSTTTDGGTLQATEGTPMTLPDNMFTAKEGYYFIGWSLSHLQGGELLGETYTFKGNDSVYAQWKEIYTINFDGNTGTGTTASIQAKQDIETTLPENGFTAPSLKQFKGWSLTADGATLLPAKYTFTSNDTVYAIWEDLDGYTITYDLGGAGTLPTSKAYADTPHELSAIGSITHPSNYVFMGWSLTADGTALPSHHTFTENTTVYALWRAPQTYRVTLSSNGGGGGTRTLTATEGVELELPVLTDFTPPLGRVFRGWSLTSDGAVLTDAETFTADTTVYAIWSDARQLTFTFNKNGGTGTQMPNAQVTEGDMMTLPENTYTAPSGMEFLGWSLEPPEATDMMFLTIKPTFDTSLFTVMGAPENITLYAVWIPAHHPLQSKLEMQASESLSNLFPEVSMMDIVILVDNDDFTNVANLLEFGDIVYSYTEDGKTLVGEFAIFSTDTTIYLTDTVSPNTVNITHGANGTVAPHGMSYAQANSKIDLLFMPDIGYVVDTVTINGAPITTNGASYTINNINADMEVHVTFKLLGNSLDSVKIANWTYGMAANIPTITHGSGGTGGTPTISYEGRDGTTYPSSATPPTSVGKYTITASSAAYGLIPAKAVSADFEILKAYSAGGTIDVVIKNTETAMQSIDLSAFIPSGETATINTTVIEDTNSIISATGSTANTATFTPATLTAGSTARLSAKIETANYNDITVIINLRITDKTPQTLQLTNTSYVKNVGDGTFSNSFVAPPIGTLSYVSTNTSVATVNAIGTITILGAGTADIIVTATGDVTYESAVASYKLTVNNGTVDTSTDETTIFTGNFADLEKVILNGVELIIDPVTGALSGYPLYTINGGIVGTAFESSIGVTIYKEFIAYLPSGTYALNVTTSTDGGTSSTTVMTVPIKTAHAITVNNDGYGTSGTSTYTQGQVVSLTAGVRSGYTFTSWTISGDGHIEDATSANASLLVMGDATITANWKKDGSGTSGSGGGSGRSVSTMANEYDFWQDIKEAVQDANSGDTIKVDAKNYDKMPWTLMEELNSNDVNLVIEWNGGETILIPQGDAQEKQMGRIYWPLSLLAELYAEAELPEDVAVEQINPETGGILPGGSYSNVFEAPTFEAPLQGITPEPSSPIGGETISTEIAPPTAGFEAEAFAGTEDNITAIAEQEVKATNNIINIVAIVIMLAAIGTSAFALYRKKEAKGK